MEEHSGGQPGWYPDPAGGPGLLYWNGSNWQQPGAAPPPPPKSRRGLWIAAVAVIGLFGLSSQCSQNKQHSESTATSTETSAAAAPSARTSAAQVPAAKYNLVGQRKRFDNQPINYVAIDPVDLGNDGFKNTVKNVIRTLAEHKGDGIFSAWVYDNTEVAKAEFADDLNPPIGDTPDEIRAKNSQRDPHLIAIYSGGMPNDAMLYGIFWFPAATKGSAPPNIAQWIGHEEFKP